MVVRTAAVALGLVAAGSAMHGSRTELPGWLAGCWELRQGADSLIAWIEGPGRDGVKRIEYPMRRMDCRG